MIDKLCLVLDIDETLVHYDEYVNPRYFKHRHYNDDEKHIPIEQTKSIILRPGLIEFFDYVNKYNPDNIFRSVSTSPGSPAAPTASTASQLPSPRDALYKSIIIGIWTYGTRPYAERVVEILKDVYMKERGKTIDFEFVYSREDMQPGMEDKELEFILKHHGEELDIKKENVYLVDNCPSNIYHNKNIENGILVTSFIGTNLDRRDKMFEQLQNVCEDILNNNKVRSKYINKFTLNGVPTDIISIGKNGVKTWDSDDMCSLYIHDDFADNYFGGTQENKVPNLQRKTSKLYKKRTRKNKRRYYKTERTKGSTAR